MKKQLLTMHQLVNKRYSTLPFTGIWFDSFGQPEQGSKWIVYGGSGQGKSDFTVKLSKYISRYGRVLYVGSEEGASQTFQQAIVRNKAQRSDISLAVGFTFDDLIKKVRKKRSRIKTIVIDSVNDFEATRKQLNVLNSLGKNVIYVCWAEAGSPYGAIGKWLEYKVDVKIEIKKFIAYPRSRYGGNSPFIIWNNNNNR